MNITEITHPDKLIKQRKSYSRYKNLAKVFIGLGLPKENVPDALVVVHEIVDGYKGYKSQAAADYAEETILFIKNEMSYEKE